MYIYAYTPVNANHLEAVKEEMVKLGAPTIRYYTICECNIAVEGSHRLAAAKELGLMPKFVKISDEDLLNYKDKEPSGSLDCTQVDNITDVADILYPPAGAYYEF